MEGGERQDIFADNTGAVFARVPRTSNYIRYKNVWEYLERGEGEDAANYLTPPPGQAKREFYDKVSFRLQDTAVRLWHALPKNVLVVNFPLGLSDKARALTVHNYEAEGTSPEKHMDALICSLLYRGGDWSTGSQVCEFTWSLCQRMAVTKDDAKKKQHAGPFPVYTLEGTYRHSGSDWTPKGNVVALILAAAYDDAMRAMRRPLADDKTILELFAYASIAKGFARKKLPGSYTGNWSVFEPRELGTNRPLLYEPKLELDALYVMHAARATDKEGNSARLEYLSKGTFNVVFGISKDAILRVQIQKDVNVEDQERSTAIKSALTGRGVIAETLAETIVKVGTDEHPAAVIKRFDGSLEKLTKPYFEGYWDAREDTLVELYTRLSAVGRCVDTKEANVVARKEQRSVFMALIDTEGDWCTTDTQADEHIGPVGLAELEAALAKKPEFATTPLLFASLSLLVFHAAESKLKEKKTDYPRTRHILLQYFDTIVRMALNAKSRDNNDKTSNNFYQTLFFYANAETFDGVKERLNVTNLENPPRYDYARAYWTTDRLIDDFPASEPPTPESEIARKLAIKIVSRVKAKYTVNPAQRRLKAHVALAEARYTQKRQLLATLHTAADVAEKCSVDLFTAEAFLALARLAESQKLYTEEPQVVVDRAELPKSEPASCAESISALFRRPLVSL